MNSQNPGELIVYRTVDGQAELPLQSRNGSVWLNQSELAELFDTTKQNISLHIKNILKAGELPEGATVKESLTLQANRLRDFNVKPVPPTPAVFRMRTRDASRTNALTPLIKTAA